MSSLSRSSLTHKAPHHSPSVQECLRLIKEQWECQHPCYQGALANMGMVLRRQGKPEEACKLYKEALPVTEREFGKNSVEVANILDKIGSAFGGMGRAEEARQNYEKVCETV